MALRWLVDLYREKKEDPVAALEPFVEVPGAFWPQLELGRVHLEADRIRRPSGGLNRRWRQPAGCDGSRIRRAMRRKWR